MCECVFINLGRVKIMITTKIENITPEVAAGFILLSCGNRRLKEDKVRGYMRDMKEGRWMPNGESIIFDASGALIDGHHRLTAAVRAGFSFQSVVVRGVAPESLKTIDTGSSRSSNDLLMFSGYKNANQLNAIVRALMSLKKGKVRSAIPTSQEVFDFISQNPLTIDAARFVGTHTFTKITPMIGALYVVAHEQGRGDDIHRFAKVLRSGVPSYDGCPAHVLRERILSAAVRGNPLSIREAFNLCANAWDRFSAGDAIQRVSLRKSFSVAGYE